MYIGFGACSSISDGKLRGASAAMRCRDLLHLVHSMQVVAWV